MKTLPTHFVPLSITVTAGLFLFLAATQFAAAQNFGGTLTRPDSADKAPRADGFIQRWLVLEPVASGSLAQNAVQTAVKSEPFANLLKEMPHDGEEVTVGGSELTWHAVDTKNYNVNLYHFASSFDRSPTNALFLALTIVNCPDEMPGVRLAIGSNAASVWWVNGQEVIGIYNDRQTVVDDGVSKRLTLKKGANFIRAAIVNAGGATDFCAACSTAKKSRSPTSKSACPPKRNSNFRSCGRLQTISPWARAG